MEKMTYTMALESVLSTAVMSDEVKEKLTALKAQLEKRTGAQSGKETKAQREASAFAEQVFEVLKEFEEPVQCGVIAKRLEVSGQKVSAALRKLVKEQRVEKTEDKRVSKFACIIVAD